MTAFRMTSLMVFPYPWLMASWSCCLNSGSTRNRTIAVLFIFVTTKDMWLQVPHYLWQTFRLSLSLWRKYGKMSLTSGKTVPEIVENYRKQFPTLERPLLRRLIRSENKELFGNPSNLKQLDRHLRKAFKTALPVTPARALTTIAAPAPRNLAWALDALAGYHEPVYFKRLDQKKE